MRTAFSPRGTVDTYSKTTEVSPRLPKDPGGGERGARHFFPSCGTVIDIGGQDTKVVRLAPGGTVTNFEMNDRCAAGTGRFLEMMAHALGYSIDTFGLHCEDGEQIAVNSLCAVFAESEVISLITKGVKERPSQWRCTIR